MTVWLISGAFDEDVSRGAFEPGIIGFYVSNSDGTVSPMPVDVKEVTNPYTVQSVGYSFSGVANCGEVTGHYNPKHQTGFVISAS